MSFIARQSSPLPHRLLASAGRTHCHQPPRRRQANAWLIKTSINQMTSQKMVYAVVRILL